MGHVREGVTEGHKSVALDILLELLDAPLVKKTLFLDKSGCGPHLSGALSYLSQLAPGHPAIAPLTSLLTSAA